MMPDPLTDLERRILDYLIEYLRTNTYQPSIREIGREFAIKSTKTVSELLQSLADKGWIERDPSRSRGVRLLTIQMRAETVSVPVYETSDSMTISTHFDLDRKLVPGNGAFVLAMVGDHLREEGVLPGDLLIVESVDAESVENGDLVLARNGGGSAVRRCVRHGTELSLEPVRRGELPLTLTPRQAAGVIRGRVSSVVRRIRPVIQAESLAIPVPIS
jgi:repressor LexA